MSPSAAVAGMLPSGDLVDTLRLVGAGVVVVGAGLLLFAPRLYPRVDLVSPWRPGKALQRLDLAKDNYLGYATAAALPGNPWMGMLFSSPSKKKFQEFGKGVFIQIEEMDGLVGHFRVARPLRNEYIWVTIWESRAGINDFYKAGSHGQAMASYRADAGKIGSGNSSGAPFNVRFTVTGEEVKQMASNYNNVLDYWYNLRDTVAKTIKGGMLKA